MLKTRFIAEALRFVEQRTPFIAESRLNVFINPLSSGLFEAYRATGTNAAARLECGDDRMSEFLRDIFSYRCDDFYTKWAWKDATGEQMEFLKREYTKGSSTPAPSDPVHSAPADDFTAEHIYILTNPMLPDLIKIGRTDRSPEERAMELSSASGVPAPFRVFRSFRVRDSFSAEATIHNRLDAYRIASNREFFRLDPEWASAVIAELFPQDVTENTPFDGVEGDGVLQLRAYNLRSKHRYIWPGLIAAQLGVSYGDADTLFRIMCAKGVISSNGYWT